MRRNHAYFSEKNQGNRASSHALDSYENLQKCIHVSILDFIRFPDDDRCYRTIHFQDTETGTLYNDKMELQILELKKLPKEVQTGEDIVNWMLFFNAKNRKEFEAMARTDEYLGEAYEALQKLSADDRKRIEYEAREKALKDYNTQISCAEKRGEKRGEARGKKQGQQLGIQLARKVFKLHMQGKSYSEIAAECNTTAEQVQEILA